jgi:glutamate synthase (NADPH/NADH) small chain
MTEPSVQKKDRAKRTPMAERPPEVRRADFDEVPLGYAPQQARAEASRCLLCKKPQCITGCPVGIDIPGFVKLIVEGKFEEAADRILLVNALPAVCGRVCPQETQCEVKCVLGKKGDPLAIGNLERFVADFKRTHGTCTLPPAPQPTKKLALAVPVVPVRAEGQRVSKKHSWPSAKRRTREPSYTSAYWCQMVLLMGLTT